MGDLKDWGKIKIWGQTLVSNFTSIDCTDGHFVEYTPQQLGEPEEVLASFGYNYYSVVLDHYEDTDVFIRIHDKVYKVEPGLRVTVKKPLSYAWSETEVYVEPAKHDPKEIFKNKEATEQQTRDAIDWCMQHISDTDNKMLEDAADRLYMPKYRILDHQQAKRCYSVLAERPDRPDSVRYKCYCRIARISYLALQADEGDGYVAKAAKIYPSEIEPYMLQADYEWYTHKDDYSDLYRYGKLPRIKALVNARRWQAMAYLLGKIIPLQDEGMRTYAELCETVLMETYRHSDETNYDAVAPVAFWEFIEANDYRKFRGSWYCKQLILGIQHASHQAMYFYAYVNEITGYLLETSGDVKGAKYPIKVAMGYYRNCLDSLDRSAMSGLVSMMFNYDPENAELPFYIKCLRTFSYSGQKYPFLDGETDDEHDDDYPDDDYPDDDGRFDPYS